MPRGQAPIVDKAKRRKRSRYPATPSGAWNELNERFFEGRLPSTDDVQFKWIADGDGEGEAIRTSEDLACTSKTEGKWLIELNDVLKSSPKLMMFMLAHEAIHVILGITSASPSHGSAAWNREVRRLNGRNLLGKLL